MEDESLIARNVRARMEAKGIGQKALSRQAGLNETYVRDILEGRSRNPRQAHLQKLATALECSVGDLTGEPQRLDAVGAASDQAKRDLLDAFERLHQRDRVTLLRIARSLKPDDPPTLAPSQSKGPKPVPLDQTHRRKPAA